VLTFKTIWNKIEVEKYKGTEKESENWNIQ